MSSIVRINFVIVVGRGYFFIGVFGFYASIVAYHEPYSSSNFILALLYLLLLSLYLLVMSFLFVYRKSVIITGLKIKFRHFTE